MTTDTRRPRTGLGRGLASLIPVAPEDHDSPPTGASVREVAIERIVANPHQPRHGFDEADLQALADSIRAHGVLQPVLVTGTPEGFRLIAGERRLRASQLAGRTTIPVVIRGADEQQQLALALVENLQRADLNAMDEALAFRRLIDEFGLTQEQVAQQVGRSRAAIANTLRLLAVAPALQDALRAGRITEGHARALAGMPRHDEQERLLAVVEQRGLSVRQTEQLVRAEAKAAATPGTPPAPRRTADDDPDLDRMTAHLRETLGTKVVLSPGRKGGRIIIDWYESDDLVRLYERLAGGDQ
ncbi:MAG: ParB/RepB/Spo0J family partition protein [Chloroflexota bacterium]